MSEVEHTEMLQIADLRRYLSEVVIGQNEGLDFKTLPYFVRDKSEVLLPEVDMHAALMRHMVHFNGDSTVSQSIHSY